MSSLINFFIALMIIFLGLLILIFVPFVFGAPFEPSRMRKVRRIVELSKVRKGQKTADLGSGDGRLVIGMARLGAEAHGFEINPFLVWISRSRIKKAGLSGRAFIHWKSFWGADFSKFDIITAYQIGYVMGRLGRKIKREMKKGSKIVSNTWKFPNLELVRKEEGVYLYMV